jgi:hypothetical protein
MGGSLLGHHYVRGWRGRGRTLRNKRLRGRKPGDGILGSKELGIVSYRWLLTQ